MNGYSASTCVCFPGFDYLRYGFVTIGGVSSSYRVFYVYVVQTKFASYSNGFVWCSASSGVDYVLFLGYLPVDQVVTYACVEKGRAKVLRDSSRSRVAMTSRYVRGFDRYILGRA